MNCSNKNCNMEIIAFYGCIKCKKPFCGKKCLNDHLKLVHNKISLFPPFQNEEVLQKSSRAFIPKGKLLMIFDEDPLYDLANFDFVKTKANAIQSIGQGTFSDVYLAKNKIDQKLYAIKHIQKARIKATGQTLDIVDREISLHKLFIHNNIIRLHGFKEEKEAYHIILEYANMGTLFSLIRKQGNLDEQKAFEYFIQTAFAVNFLHENHYAHRDLKPENILLTDDHTIKLCDFGWCVDTSQGNRETFCGTYEYMAPEIIQEIPYDKSIDVWSLGILLYELLHGYSPFRAENSRGHESYQEIFKNIMNLDYTIEKSISAECVDLISKLLTADQTKRIEVYEIFDHPWVSKYKNKVGNSINTNPFRLITPINNKDNISKRISNTSENTQRKKDEMKEKLNIINQPFSFNSIPDTNFSLFEDNVFEETLKIIDSKKKRKVRNDLDYNEIRVCNTSKQFESINSNRIKQHNKEKEKEENEYVLLKENTYSKDSASDIISNLQKNLAKESTNVNMYNINNIKNELKHPIPIKPDSKQVIVVEEETPTPVKEVNEENKDSIIAKEINVQIEDNKTNKLSSAIDLLEKAKYANDNYNENINKIPIKAHEEESFWDRFLAPFKCGS